MAEKIEIFDSKNAHKALGVLSDDLKRVTDDILKTSEAVRKLNTSLSGIKSISDLTSRINKLESAQKRANSKMTEADKLARALKVSQDKLALSLSKENKQLQVNRKRLSDTNRQLRNTVKSTKKVSSAFGRLGTSLKNLIAGFGILKGIQVFSSLVKNIFNLTKEFDSLGFSMKTIIKTSLEVESTTRFLIRISKDYGAEIVSLTNRYIKFIAAADQSNISQKDTEKIFRSVTKAASVLGLKTDELRGIFLALEQMLSKGKVTTEELRRQLGERLPGAMGIMAAALGVTIPKLDEMLKKGEVLSSTALPKFADALELAFGIQSVTKVNTLVTAQNRLSNSWKLWIKDITEGESTLKAFFSFFIIGLTNAIDFISEITQSRQLRMQTAIIKAEIEFDEKLKKQVEFRLKTEGKIIADRTKEILGIRSKIILAKTTEDKIVQEKALSELLKLELKQVELIKET